MCVPIATISVSGWESRRGEGVWMRVVEILRRLTLSCDEAWKISGW